MKEKHVKDLMIPVGNYPTVNENATLLDAMNALEEAQQHVGKDMHPYRAVLVVDDDGNIMGKIGHLAFLRGIEPKYELNIDKKQLNRANLSSDFIDSMMEHYNLWEETIEQLAAKVGHIRVKNVMKPVDESIDENATLAEAVHNIVMWKTLSMLVSRGDKIVGIIRLSDVYNEIALAVKSFESKKT
ncbi:MAG: CBS domain-containing protein [Candidatus Kapaibacterium sp.]